MILKLPIYLPNEQTIFEVRSLTAYLLGGHHRYVLEIYVFLQPDSVATTPTFATPPVSAGDTLATSIHVVTDTVSTGTAHVQIEVGTFHNPKQESH